MLEEWVGQLWHSLITRAAGREYPQAAVSLDEVRQPVAVLFRALGGNGALRIESAHETAFKGRRRLLSRIAGTDRGVTLAWRDEAALRLPACLAHYPERDLNRQLYLWLAALAARHAYHSGDWLQRNAAATRELLTLHPGLYRRYRLLAEGHLSNRPDIQALRAEEARQEALIRAALRDPWGAEHPLPVTGVAPRPVPLWLHPQPPGGQVAGAAVDPLDKEEDDGDERSARPVETDASRQGERVEASDDHDGLLAFRLESLFTRAEYAAVDRPSEENEDEYSRSALEEQRVVSVAAERRRISASLRFDLDLPPEDNDDLYLGEGLAFPEWDYRRQQLQPDYCRVQLMQARSSPVRDIPEHLRCAARRVRRLLETSSRRPHWNRAQNDGSEPDLDALIDHCSDRLRGARRSDADLYRRLDRSGRDLACLLLADLSLSTDAHVNDEQRVIDVVRDSLFLFTEALQATGDRFAIYGFSSRRRNHVRCHLIKAFDEKGGDRVRARIQAIRPGYYTRMGAAIRYATEVLGKEPGGDKLLLLLTDGKPNDLDKYEGRYGVEDTRQAIREARNAGLRPFCVTVDDKAKEYLPYLFGSNAYVRIRNASELPAKLPLLYARLTLAG